MKIPVLFCIFLIFLAVSTYKRRKSERLDNEAEYRFWEKENSANTTRRQDISHLDYVDFSGVTLPFALFSDDFLQQCEAQLLELRDKKILNLTGISNTDLKLQYGAANLPFLMECDQNFTLLVRTLNQWGHRLHELSHDREAAAVLEFAVSIGSDIKATYQLLITLYLAAGDHEKIESLRPYAQKLHSLNQKPILNMIEHPE